MNTQAALLGHVEVQNYGKSNEKYASAAPAIASKVLLFCKSTGASKLTMEQRSPKQQD